METTGNKVMTNAEETRELRRWLREDSQKAVEMVAALHEKIDKGNREIRGQIDDCNKENQAEHKVLASKIAEIHASEKVNGSKIVGLASLVSILVSGAIITAFNVLAG